MIVTAIVSVGMAAGIMNNSGAASAGPDSTPSISAQSGSSTVPPVNSSSESPDWQAVAAAVRPATVSIQADSNNTSGTGSGVIINEQGDIITNYHVVSDVATSGGDLTVTLYDGRRYIAQVVGVDSTTDLAVISLENPPQDLTAARFASSKDLQVGQPVMAIGSPLGLSDTATTGIISALDRPVVVSGESTSGGNGQFGLPGQSSGSDAVVTNAIQIDASINPGNSGGPLFDATGAVVGINSSIATQSSEAGSIGLGFAIPSDLVSSVVDQILTDGQAQHALLGVTIGTGTATVDGTTWTGAGVASVTPDGAAAQAGLREGDVILSIGGNRVVSGPSLTGFVRRYQGGETVTLEVVRDSQRQEVQVTLQTK